VPTLDAQPGSAPLVGQPLTLELGNLPQTPLAFVASGLSRTQDASVARPLEPSLLVMPGCTQFVSDIGMLQAKAAAAGAAR
jgi:hypothetical protein